MLRPSRRTALTALATAILAACLLAPFVLRRTSRFYSDGKGIREEVSDARAALREILWQPPIKLPAGINRPESDEYEPRVSPDGGWLAFTRGRPGGYADLWISERRASGWAEPQPMREINTQYDEMGACFALAGPRSSQLVLYFYSDRPGGEGGYDVWASLGDGEGGWGVAFNLGPQVNSPFSELSPSTSTDSTLLLFATNRRSGRAPEPPRWTSTVRETLEVPDYDIYSAGRLEGTRVEFGEAALVPSLSLPGWTEGAVAVTPLSDFVYFASNRSGGQGGFDLYRARIGDGEIGAAESLGPRINTAGHELDPALTSNGFELYFVRREEGQATEDIYVSTSREVFLKTESGDTYWSSAAVMAYVRGVLRSMEPAILALILSCLVCLLFIAFFGRRMTRFALLTRCFLVALMIHLVVAIWMNSTRVQRVLLGTLGDEESYGSFEVSVENVAEENLAYSIRGQTAETGSDAAPAFEAGTIAQAPVLAPREYAVVPRMLELESPDAAAGALAQTGMSASVRPPPGAVASPGFEREAAREPLGVAAVLPAEERITDPGSVAAPRALGGPEAPRPEARTVGFTQRVEGALPPADDVGPLPTSLETEVARDGAAFESGLRAPGAASPDRLRAERDEERSLNPTELDPVSMADPAASVAEARQLASPEAPRAARSSDLRLERPASRTDARVARSQAMEPTRAVGGGETESIPRVELDSARRDARDAPEVVAAALPESSVGGVTSSVAPARRSVTPEAAALAGAQARQASLKVEESAGASRIAAAAGDAASILAPVAPDGQEASSPAREAQGPAVAARREAAERPSTEAPGLPVESPSVEPGGAIATQRRTELEAGPALASSREQSLRSTRQELSRAESPRHVAALQPSAAQERPRNDAPVGATVGAASHEPAERQEAEASGAPLPVLEPQGVASAATAMRATAPEAAATAPKTSALVPELSARARGAEQPDGLAIEAGGVKLQPARTDAQGAEPPAREVSSPQVARTRESADPGPSPPPSTPGAAAPVEVGVPVAGVRSAPAGGEQGPSSPGSPGFFLERRSPAESTEVAASKVLVPQVDPSKPRNRLPAAASADPARIEAAPLRDVVKLPVAPGELPAARELGNGAQAATREDALASRASRLEIARTAPGIDAAAGSRSDVQSAARPALASRAGDEGVATRAAPLEARSSSDARRDKTQREELAVAARLSPPPSPDVPVSSAAASQEVALQKEAAPSGGSDPQGTLSTPGAGLLVARSRAQTPALVPAEARASVQALLRPVEGESVSARPVVPRSAPPPDPTPAASVGGGIASNEETKGRLSRLVPEAPAPRLAPGPEGAGPAIAVKVQAPGDPGRRELESSPAPAVLAVDPPARSTEATRPAVATRAGIEKAPVTIAQARAVAPSASEADRPAQESAPVLLPAASSSRDEAVPVVAIERPSPAGAQVRPAPAAAAVGALSQIPPPTRAPARAVAPEIVAGTAGVAAAPPPPAAGVEGPKSIGASAPRAPGRTFEAPGALERDSRPAPEALARRVLPPRDPEPIQVVLETRSIPVPGPPARAVPASKRMERESLGALTRSRSPGIGMDVAWIVVTSTPALAAPDSSAGELPGAPFTDPTSDSGKARMDAQLAARRKSDRGSLEPVQAASAFVPKIYQLRSKSRREEAVRLGGGDAETEHAVDLGLKWLATHQSPDGRWDLRDYMRHLPQVSDRDRWHPDWEGRGKNDSRGGTSRAENGDMGATGLALLAFLGHGDTQVEAGPYQATVQRGFRYLLGRQQRDGDLRGEGNLYMHALAAFAICEAFALTRDPELEEPARRAIGFTLRSQNPDLGGWRYEPYPQGREVDTSVFGWMLMAIKSARLAGIQVEKRAVTRMAKYLESARMSRGGGRYAYQPGLPRSSVAMTAQGFFCQQVLSEFVTAESETEQIRLRRAANESVSILLQNRPEAADQDGANFYYWYYATLALFQEEGVAWETWNSRMKQVLLGLQLGEENGTAAGSWDPLDRRAALGGRVYSTAISVLTLEVYYRYAPKGK